LSPEVLQALILRRRRSEPGSWVIEYDGSLRADGTTSWAARLLDYDGVTVWEAADLWPGYADRNCFEAKALAAGLGVLLSTPYPIGFLTLRGDAQPFVTSLTRFKPHWRPPDRKSGAACFRWTALCLSILGELGVPWCAEWVARSENSVCDRLAKQVVSKTKRHKKKKG